MPDKCKDLSSCDMFSGSDSTESQNYTQWALNPSAYQNVSNDQVDWAALAQQWIIMKEAGPPVPDQMPNVPPPPNISKTKKEHLHEGGEAPMDVENDKDDEHLPPWNSDSLEPRPWNWQQQAPPPQQQQQPPPSQPPWGWNSTWPVPAGVPPPSTIKAPLLPTPPSFNQFPPAEADNSSFPGYNSVPSVSSEYQGGYWTAAGSSKVIKPHNKRYSKVNVPVPVPVTPKQPPVILDAAKRKQLPAWIREGLEKMEREKQKQIDKERDKQAKEEYEEKMKLSEKEAMDIIKSTVKEQQKGRFDSDDDNSEDTDGRPLTPEPVALTQEELMLKVRRTMTEILLKVTNKEIYNICKEELQRHVKKMKASDQRVSAPSGANISAKLGLGVYGGSGSSSEDSDEETTRDLRDSDSDLKDIIRRRKAEFSKTEREIEERLAVVDGKGEDSRAATPESDNDSQVDAKIQGYKRRNVSESTPPPKKYPNPKRTKKSRKSSTSSDCSDSDREKKKRRKFNRSPSSSDSEKRKSRYSGSDSRGRTPEPKKSKHSSSSKSSSSQSRRSRSKSESKRRRSRSVSRKRDARDSVRSRNRPRRSRSRSHKSRRSRSSSRQRSSYYRSRRSRSRSRNQRSSSRSSFVSRRSRRSRSRSPRHRRSRSYSSSRGKRSHRH